MQMGTWEQAAPLDRKDLLAAKGQLEAKGNKEIEETLGTAEIREDPEAREKV